MSDRRLAPARCDGRRAASASASFTTPAQFEMFPAAPSSVSRFDGNYRGGKEMSVDTYNPESSGPWILSRTDGVAAASQDVLLVLGRVLLGWIFVQSGWRKLMDIPAFVATIPRRGLPDFLGYVAPPVEFVGGLFILFGLATRYTALLMLLFIIIASFSSHRYWTFTDAAQLQQQHSHFWKNVSMMGGQVLLFLTGAGRYSVDRLLMRHRG
jgi:putative oxidoreductase